MGACAPACALNLEPVKYFGPLLVLQSRILFQNKSVLHTHHFETFYYVFITLHIHIPPKLH